MIDYEEKKLREFYENFYSPKGRFRYTMKRLGIQNNQLNRRETTDAFYKLKPIKALRRTPLHSR